MPTPRTVVIMGKGTLACRVASWFRAHPESYRIIHVVPVQPADAFASLQHWAERNALAELVVASGSYRDIPGVREGTFRCDLAVSVTYDKIIKADFIGQCGRIINIHNSPLPRYAGVRPINWALQNGEREHGVTIHEILPGIDDGPIISQVKFPIDPEQDEVIDVLERALNYGWLLFKQTMPKLWETAAVPQDESQRLYYGNHDNDKLTRNGFSRSGNVDPLDYQLISGASH